MDEEAVLSSDNWRDVVIEAIDSLPDDIKASVGYTTLGEETMAVTVAGEPIDGEDGESFVSTINIQWWDTMRKQGWSKEQDEIYGVGGLMAERADWPVISVEAESIGRVEGHHPGRARIREFLRTIQLAIMDEMFEGGGASLISKDEAGRFRRDDGALILDWQNDAG